MICPNCKADLQGDLIYQTFLDQYGDETKALETAALYGATKTDGHWGREIAIYDWNVDRTVAHQCPDCEHTWPREFVPIKSHENIKTD